MTNTDAGTDWEVTGADGSKTRLGWEADPLDASRLHAYIEHYRIDGVRLNRTEFKHDGSRLAYAWDPTPKKQGPAWHTSVQSFDTNANLVRTVYTMDDGTSEIWEWDPYGQQDWSFRKSVYAAVSGLIIRQEDTIHDARPGPVRSIVRQWDYTTLPWTAITTEFDHGGRELTRKTIFDDDHELLEGFDIDQDGANYGSPQVLPEEWQSFQERKNADGNKDFERYVYWGATATLKHSVEKGWDYNGADWSDYTFESNSLDKPVKKVTNYDTNPTWSKTVEDWQYAIITGDDGWSHRRTDYDKAGRLLAQHDRWLSGDVVNRGILRSWDWTAADWARTASHYRGDASAVLKEERWYDRDTTS